MFDWIADIFGGSDNGDKQTTTQNDYQMAPEYSEATGARASWWDTLQKWGSEPGYGAIQPNWNDIWSNASQKVQRYFNGGPEGPGVNAKIKSRSAARGVGDQAAGDAMLQRSGFQQGNMLQDIAVQQAMEEARLGEQGRNNWMTSLMGLAGQKPQMLNMGTTSTTEYAKPGLLTGAGNAALSSGGSGGIMDMLNPIMGMFGMGGQNGATEDTGIGDVDSGDGGFGIKEGADLAIKAIPMLMSMFCWVAAEIFGGWNEPKTVACRYYIGEIAPEWFRSFYIKHGESFAEFIKDKPVIKAMIRPVFEVFAAMGRKQMSEVSYG